MSGRRSRLGLLLLRGPTTNLAATGADFPLAVISISSPNSKLLAALTVRSLARIAQGSAACCRRAATLVASPVMRKSPADWSRLATTSPVLTPNQIGRASCRERVESAGEDGMRKKDR